MPIPVLELTADELADAMTRVGQPAYRAQQVAEWVYRRGVTDPAGMTNLPAELAGELEVLTSRVVARSDSGDGTIKLLLELSDGLRAECVLIPTDRRATACVSTQVGCVYACAFCATGQDGFKRNLSASEILQQLVHLRQAAGRRITNVVFMGMGEPLANYDATVRAIRAITDLRRFAISARSVVVSTVGLPGAIRRLAAEDLPVTLAISLHAPNDALRYRLMPRASRTPLEGILAAAQTFYSARKREVTLEYVLLAGENDTNVCAEALAKIAHRLRCSVNLIRYNPVPSLPFVQPTQQAVRNFADRLRRRGVNVQVRRPRGADADAACGQLRQRTAAEAAAHPQH